MKVEFAAQKTFRDFSSFSPPPPPPDLLVLAWERMKEETYAHDGAALRAVNN